MKSVKLFTALTGLAWLSLSSCGNPQQSESTAVSQAIRSYQAFLETFKSEIEKSAAGETESDKWEAAVHSLLINTEEKNNEILRQWKSAKLNENSPLLSQWVETELFALELERIILNGWKNAESKEFAEALTQLSQAETALEETEETSPEMEELRNQILAAQRENETLFGEALTHLALRRKELQQAPEALIKR